MTDHTTPTPGKAKHPLTPEQIAALSADEKQELIAELTAAIEALQRPVPQPYPKWVEIGGVNQIVDSPEDEEKKMHADAAFQKEQGGKRPTRPGAHPEHPIEEPPSAEPRRPR